MNYQLVALDLDGTLLTDDKRITTGTKVLLERLQREGIYIAICTGRAALSVRRLLQDQPFASHFITDNGGTIKDIETGQVLYSNTIPRSYLAVMKQVMETFGVHIDVTTEKYIYVEVLTDDMQKKYGEYLIKPKAIGDLSQVPIEPLKFTISGEPSLLDNLVSQLNEQYGSDLKFVRSGEYFIDIMKAGTTKGKALSMLADHLQIAKNNVIAMGNYYNDVEMLRYAGLGIAMDNSPAELKAIADEVTLSNNEEGVRLALEKHLMSDRIVR